MGRLLAVLALTCVLAVLPLLPAWVSPAQAQSSDELAPTWGEQVSRSTAELRQEEAKLAEAEADLREAEEDGSSYSYIDSRQERVDYYSQSVAVARARVRAAEKAQAKQEELDAAGEPEGEAHELKEVIVYFETIQDGAERAGDEAAADEAREELDGGVFGAGLRERLQIAEAEQAAVQASQQGSQETTQTAEATPQSTEATTAPPPTGDGRGEDGGGGQPKPTPAPPPEPAPAPEAPSGGPTPNPATLIVFGLVALGVAASLVPQLPGAARVASRVRGAFSHSMASRKTKKGHVAVPEPGSEKPASPEPEQEPAAPERRADPEPDDPAAAELDDLFWSRDPDDADASDDADEADAGPEEGGR